MQCVILAGGLGTRLRTVSGDLPKHLVPVNGRPFADLQLEWLRSRGVTRVTYCIGHRGDAIRDHVGTGGSFGLRVDYVDEGEALRGTGGALGLAASSGALDDRFLLTYGDSLLDVDVEDVWRVHAASGLAVTMTVFPNAGRFGPDNVIFESGRLVRYSKSADPETLGRMRHIDYGLLVMNRVAIADEFPAGATGDLAPYLERLSVLGQLGAYEVYERFYEIGTPESLRELELHLLSRESAAASRTTGDR